MNQRKTKSSSKKMKTKVMTKNMGISMRTTAPKKAESTRRATKRANMIMVRRRKKVRRKRDTIITKRKVSYCIIAHSASAGFGTNASG